MYINLPSEDAISCLITYIDFFSGARCCCRLTLSVGLRCYWVNQQQALLLICLELLYGQTKSKSFKAVAGFFCLQKLLSRKSKQQRFALRIFVNSNCKNALGKHFCMTIFYDYVSSLSQYRYLNIIINDDCYSTIIVHFLYYTKIKPPSPPQIKRTHFCYDVIRNFPSDKSRNSQICIPLCRSIMCIYTV